jgi:predicted SprT family Zn-dependent metalloprotease
MKLILEEFSKDQVQNIFQQMFDEFLDYSEELDFCQDCIVDTDVYWMSRVNTKVLGRCVKLKDEYRMGRELKHFKIELNPFLLNLDDANEKVIKEVIAHEFCHTLPDCLNHGKEFHRKAKMIYDLMGYKIDTKADVDASNYFKLAQTVGDTPYKVKCDNCGAEQKFARLNDYVKNSWQYVCKQCGKPYLVSYKLNKSTGNYVELISREKLDALRRLYGVEPL